MARLDDLKALREGLLTRPHPGPGARREGPAWRSPSAAETN